MKCERVRTYSWTGNEVWECKGHTLPAPDGQESWNSPTEYDDYLLLTWREFKAHDYPPLDPTAES